MRRCYPKKRCARVKVDENLPASLCLLLRESHLDFDTVQDEGLSGKPDRIVMEVCRGEGLALITLDGCTVIVEEQRFRVRKQT